MLASLGMVPPLIVFSLYLPAHGHRSDVSFEQALQDFDSSLEEMQRQFPGSFVLGGADCNTQLRALDGLVGDWNGAIERPHDQERADLLLGMLAVRGMKAPSSFTNLGPTRVPWTKKLPRQQGSVIDYLFATQKLETRIIQSAELEPSTTTDHKPLGMAVIAPHASRKDRRAQFEKNRAQKPEWTRRIPTTWAPSNEVQFRERMKSLRFSTLSEVAPLLREVATEQTSVETQAGKIKRQLLNGIRNAQDSEVRMAYQVQLRNFRRQQRETRERAKILDWAKGANWDFTRQNRIPSRMRIPPTLDGEPDRGKWGQTMGTYLRDLYSADREEADKCHQALWRIIEAARKSPQPPLKCHPNELRDLLKELPPHKAAGPDGVPSQLLRSLSFQQTCDLASLFTDLANNLDYRPQEKPESWNQALAILLPKDSRADTLDRHRAIALMCQLQKLFGKWLLAQVTAHIDAKIAETQFGFRRKRQASEVMQVVTKLIEMSQEWTRPLTIMRLDMRKAFDRLKQSAILTTLEAHELDPKITFNIARELVGTHLVPQMYGCAPDEPIPLQQGTKQGAPESGLLFIAALNHTLAALNDQWTQRREGCTLGNGRIHHLLFADDLLLVGPSPHNVHQMFREAQPVLAEAGLDLNPEKTAYITTHPAQAQKLPGKNANAIGLKILGRIFAFRDTTDEDIQAKISGAWSRFNKIRHILAAHTPVPHRLRIFRSCVGQSLYGGVRHGTSPESDYSE